jgi:hypothetical protein
MCIMELWLIEGVNLGSELNQLGINEWMWMDICRVLFKVHLFIHLLLPGDIGLVCALGQI